MSASANPISPERFAIALEGLPLSNLFAKGAELRNSVAHLRLSNEALTEEADAGDKDCAEAIEENIQVIARMQERLQLLQNEVEKRGYNWDESKNLINGDSGNVTNEENASGGQISNGAANETTSTVGPANQRMPETNAGGQLGDEELRRLINERLAEEEENDDGVHL
jgi:hypothetical protein